MNNPNRTRTEITIETISVTTIKTLRYSRPANNDPLTVDAVVIDEQIQTEPQSAGGEISDTNGDRK